MILTQRQTIKLNTTLKETHNNNHAWGSIADKTARYHRTQLLAINPANASQADIDTLDMLSDEYNPFVATG